MEDVTSHSPEQNGDQARPKLPKRGKSSRGKPTDQQRGIPKDGSKAQIVDDNSLRIALQRAAELGDGPGVQLLLHRGAKTDVITEKGLTPLYRAVDAGHLSIVDTLLDNKASPETCDRYGKTALMAAAIKGSNDILERLLDAKANVNATDNESRTVLHELATDLQQVAEMTLLNSQIDNTKSMKRLLDGLKQTHRIAVATRQILSEGEPATLFTASASGARVSEVKPMLLQISEELASTQQVNIKVKPRWDEQTLWLLLSQKPDLGKLDKVKRTSLHWAAVTGNVRVAKYLLAPQLLAHDLVDLVDTRALLSITTDRGKTALHLAAESDQLGMVQLLLDHGAELEATSDGSYTPLLNAAKSNNVSIVDLFLERGAEVNAQTSSGMTALHWAAENGHLEVVRRILEEPDALKNSKDNFDSTPLVRASQHNHREIVEELKIHMFARSLSPTAREACERFNAAVVDFWYDESTHERNIVQKKSVYEILYALDPKDKQKELSKQRFAVTTAISQLPKRPDFRWFHLPANNAAWAESMITKAFLEEDAQDVASFKAMLRVLTQQQHRGPQPHSRFMRPFCQRVSAGQMRTEKTPHPTPKVKQRSRSQDRPRLSATNDMSASMSSVPDSPTPQGPGHTPSQRPERSPRRPLVPRDGATVLFMPYLHWEEDKFREKLSRAAEYRQEPGDRPPPDDSTLSKDELLIKAYLHGSKDLHIRRTLDQFNHHSISTRRQDEDQVVYRFCRDRGRPLKIYMVDQLWMWVFGSDLVLTCFPERWGQPRRDPLNLFDSLIEDINSKTRPPVRTVHQLATLITDRCTGTFDRHQWNNEDYLFLEMFEVSIGTMTLKETALFERFKRDSTAAAQWLKSHDKPSRFVSHATDQESIAGDSLDEETGWLRKWLDEDEEGKDPTANNRFVDRLLNIAKEARLIVECKDIRDELFMLKTVLLQQKMVLHDLTPIFRRECGGDSVRMIEMTKKLAQQDRLLDLHILDIERMDKQAEGVYTNLSHVLDLKQKHANALEARFARDQAQDTARQGQTIMVFTLVTIIFLPLGFMAAFFTINIIEFPHDNNNNGGLRLNFVAKYLFGIGIGVVIPLIAIALLFSDISDSWRNFRARPRKKTKKQDKVVDAAEANDRELVQRLIEIEKPRKSGESFFSPKRVDTGVTARSQRTQDLV